MSALRPVLLAVLFVLVGTATVGAGPDERRFADLDAWEQRELAEATRTYLDPDLEFAYTPRRALEERLAAEGVDALGDLAFLRDVVYQGRHFLPRFTDRAWANSVGITVKKTKGIYENVESEDLRFTFTTPKGYPAGSELYKKVPRVAPYPLLIALHERTDERDGLGKRVEYVGEAVLTRRYPKDDFAALYQTWFTLAPVAQRARFVEEGRLAHRFFSLPLREFWRRYHVDFERIVVDGDASAATAVANFPYAFAGLVLRGGEVDPALARNIPSVPVYVLGEKLLADALLGAGHPDVTLGDEKGLWEWLQQRRRVVPKSFAWSVYGEDAVRANWISIRDPRLDEKPTLVVSVEESLRESDPSRLEIRTTGCTELDIFLNDDVVDLDRPLLIRWNGKLVLEGRLLRSFAQVFERDPDIRKNMYFGWLYPVRLRGSLDQDGEPFLAPAPPLQPLSDPIDTQIEAEEKAQRLWDRAGEAESAGDLEKAIRLFQLVIDQGATSFEARADVKIAELGGRVQLAPALRLDVQYAFLMGRLDQVETLLRDAAGPDALYPLALIDLWWRRTRDEASVRHWERVAEHARETRLLGRRYQWLLGGGDGLYPTVGDVDTWPVLTSLVLDRIYREEMGRSGLPQKSPLALRPPPEAWADWYQDWKDSFLDWTMQQAYHGADRSRLSDDDLAAEVDADVRASGARSRNGLLAIFLVFAFIGGALALGRLAGRSSEGGSPS